MLASMGLIIPPCGVPEYVLLDVYKRQALSEGDTVRTGDADGHALHALQFGGIGGLIVTACVTADVIDIDVYKRQSSISSSRMLMPKSLSMLSAIRAT